MLFVSRTGSSDVGMSELLFEVHDNDGAKMLPVFNAGRLFESLVTLAEKVCWYNKALPLVLVKSDSNASSVILVESSNAEWPSLDTARNATKYSRSEFPRRPTT